MLLKVSEMPKGIKTLKVLDWKKIPKQTGFVDDFPKPGEINVNPEKSVKTDKLVYTCWQLVKTCVEGDGIGLHAAQVGIPKKVFVMQESSDLYRVYFHPTWSPDISATTEIEIEGCLSVKGVQLPIPRPSAILASWYEIDETGLVTPKSELLHGLRARCFMHEFDHGIYKSIVDRYNEYQQKIKMG